MAIIRRDEKSPPLGAGLIAVVVDDRSGNRDVVRCAMEEARVRQAPVLALCVGRRAFFGSSRAGSTGASTACCGVIPTSRLKSRQQC